jgi:hypothetical protein
MIKARQEGLIRGGQFVAADLACAIRKFQPDRPSASTVFQLPIRSGCTSLVILAFDTE